MVLVNSMYHFLSYTLESRNKEVAILQGLHSTEVRRVDRTPDTGPGETIIIWPRCTLVSLYPCTPRMGTSACATSLIQLTTKTNRSDLVWIRPWSVN